MIENPFSSRFVNPASCSFLWPPKIDLEKLDLGRSPSVSQIVGPHGCGKSTLANFLAGQWQQNQVIGQIHTIIIRGNEIAQQQIGELVNANLPRLLIVDGIETISMLHRYSFLYANFRSKVKVLLTTHSKLLGVRVLCEMVPDLEHFRRIVRVLESNAEIALSEQEIDRAFSMNSGDYRMSLMNLYDSWETQKLKLNAPLQI